MRKALLFLLLCSITALAGAQGPGIKYTKFVKSYNDGEHIFDAKPTLDGGYIVAGVDSARACCSNGQAGKAGNGRPWLMKLDSLGNQQWEYKPSVYEADPHYSSYTSVISTPDGGYLAVGYAGSFNLQDAYITRLRSDGRVAWSRKYGGGEMDRAMDVVQVGNEGYVVVGSTTSNDGDTGPNHSLGGSDVWLFRIDTSGNLQWQKTLGGTGQEEAYTLLLTPDNGLLIAGYAESSGGDLTANRGLKDGWIIKTDAAGNLQWQKNYGGTGNDIFKTVVLNSDGSFTAAGVTYSAQAEGYTGKGGADLWVVKLNGTNGNVVWSKGYGGTANEEGLSIKRTVGNGYVVGGYTASADGDVTTQNGTTDAWILRLSPDGQLVWQRTAGGEWDELATVVIYNSETDYILMGTSRPPVFHPSDVSDGYFVRLGESNTIKGTLYYDNNRNGVRDAGEAAFNNAVVKTTATGVEHATVPRNDAFEFYVNLGDFTTTPVVDSRYFTVVPSSATSSFTTYQNTDSFGFAVHPIPDKKDLTISLVPLTPARPGFNATYKVLYKNAGTTSILRGEVHLKKDPRLTVLGAQPAVSATNGDRLTWVYTNLEPQDSASIVVELKVKAPPEVNIGDTLVSVALINPADGDETPADDTATLRHLVTGSYDPNDKAESQGGRVFHSFVAAGKYLTYTIRFQNMGTDTAFTVTVKDTLDNRLDWSTLQMVGTSHPQYRLTITGERFLTWEFRGIDLPAVGTNERASHGYVIYRVKPLPTVGVGTVIHNTASIYFDYNLPVVTNDATTTVAAVPQAPAVSITATPATTVCKGTSVTFTASVTPAGTSGTYQWKVNGVNVGTNAASYTTTTLNDGDAVSVGFTTTTSGESVSVSSNSIIASIITVPTPTVNAGGTTTLCQGGSVVLTSSAAAGNQWYRDGTALNGATSPTYSATAGGVYTVTATANGCSSQASAGVSVTVNALPAVPTISVSGNVLTSSATSGNQWFKDGVAINGATAQSYTATASGAYSVQVTQSGCSSTSEAFNFVATSISGPAAWNGEVVAYPNPAGKELFIRNTAARRLHLQLLDAQGQKVYEGALSATAGVIKLQGLAPGVYQLLITDVKKKETISMTIIKQ